MRLVITLFDHSTAAAVRQSSGAFISQSASLGLDLRSLDTRTGLPYDLEQDIITKYRSLSSPLRLPLDIWDDDDLSRPEGFPSVVTAAVEQEEILKTNRRLNVGAAVFIPGESFSQRNSSSPLSSSSKKQLVSKTIQPVFAPLRALDWRFGLIQLDYFEGPVNQPMSSMLLSPSTQPRTLELPAIFEKRSRTGSNAEEISQNKDKRNKNKPRSGSSGTLDLGYGIIHLYKEKETKKEKNNLELQKPLTGGTELHAGYIGRPFDSTEAAKEDDEAGTMLAVLAVPSNWASSDFLQFISPSVEDIDQMRIMRFVYYFFVLVSAVANTLSLLAMPYLIDSWCSSSSAVHMKLPLF